MLLTAAGLSGLLDIKSLYVRLGGIVCGKYSHYAPDIVTFRDTLGNTEHCMLIGSYSLTSPPCQPLLKEEILGSRGGKATGYMCHESRSGDWEGGQQGGGGWRGENRAREGEIKTV